MKMIAQNFRNGLFLLLAILAFSELQAQLNPIIHENRFNGYTNHWHDDYSKEYRYGNLFKLAAPDIEKTILQSKIDVAEELGFPGFIMEEGFLATWLKAEESTNIVLKVESPDPEKFPKWPNSLGSHQYQSPDLKKILAYTDPGTQKPILVGEVEEELEGLRDYLIQTKELLKTYDLKKGWFGAKTLLKSVTCGQGHPLEVIGKGMNEGISWIVFDGYMDFLAQQELDQWLANIGSPLIADVGFAPLYGCRDYEGLQVQDMATKEAWHNFAREKGGYIFRPVYDPDWDGEKFDGYIAIEGNEEQINEENIPFIAHTGFLADNTTTSMVLFVPKGENLSKELLWESILDRKAVAVLSKARMMGPEEFRKSLQLLYLDRQYLEELFVDQLQLTATTEGLELVVRIENWSGQAITGALQVNLPPGLSIETGINTELALPYGGRKELRIPLLISPDATGRTNPIGVKLLSSAGEKSMICMLDLPPAITLHQVLYGHTPKVRFPVSVLNFSSAEDFPVQLEILKTGSEKPVMSLTQDVHCRPGQSVAIEFNPDIKPGNYQTRVSALNTDCVGQLGVGKKSGHAYLYEMDLNSDGITEYRLENDSVQVTLLRTGARVIEYIVKSRNDNVLSKIWPEKPANDKKPYRKRGFYPFGGFEDFLGQASMETHEVYDATVIKQEGDFVRVVMIADYYGNRLQKTFTLYGNSPLLEVRFALDFINPEANMLGPQPILELGQVHGTEDVFTAPTLTGLQEYRMRMEQYFGAVIHLKEGWNAGYDTIEDVAFVGAFPVQQPIFLHMWMNHPSNGESNHYYAEFQPWTPITQKNTMYFTYYLWGSGGPWQNGVEELRKRNLISVKN